MSKIHSAGFVLVSNGLILLGHPTETTGTTHGWGIPKGKSDGDETLRQTAIREFREETGFDIGRNWQQVIQTDHCFEFHVGKHKKVHAFMAFDIFGYVKDFPFVCKSLVEGTESPEIDKFRWASIEEAEMIATPSQKNLFTSILKTIRSDIAFKSLYDRTKTRS